MLGGFNNRGRRAVQKIRARTEKIASQAGATLQLTETRLTPPVTISKPSGHANILLSSTGLVTTTAAIAAGATQSFVYRAVGADGCAIEDAIALVGVAPPVPNIAISSPIARLEGNTGQTDFLYTVTRSVVTAGAVSVDWAVTGADPADFAGGVRPSGTITFANGETTKAVLVSIQADTVLEADELFTLTLSGATGGATISIASATGTIINDDAAPPSIPLAVPGSSWTGTARSGYAGSVPVRTGSDVAAFNFAGNMHGSIAAVSGFLFTDAFYPDAPFDDDITVIVNVSDPAPATVTFLVEGNEYAQAARVAVQIPVAYGSGTQTIYQYAVTLDHSASVPTIGDGGIELFAHIDVAGKSRRTVGPVRVYRKATGARYNLELTIDDTLAASPGVRYPSLAAALNYVGALSGGSVPLHTRIRAAKNLSIDIASPVFSNWSTTTRNRRGTVDFYANGFNVTVSRGSYSATASTFRPLYNGLNFFDIKFDMRNINQLASELGGAGTPDTGVVGFRSTAYIRCEAFNSLGRESLLANTGSSRTAGVFAQGALQIACTIRDIDVGDGWSHYRVGCSMMRVAGDALTASSGGAVAQYWNRLDDNDPAWFRTPLDALQIAYTGPGVASREMPGTNGDVSTGADWQSRRRKLVLRVDGAIVLDIFMGAPINATTNEAYYWPSEVVAAINALPNWSATLLNNTRRAVHIGPELASAPVPVTATPQTLQTTIFKHADGLQMSGNHDNVGFGYNYMINCVQAHLFPSLQSTALSSWNVSIHHNFCTKKAGAPPGSVSQISGIFRNLHMWDNTVPDQPFFVRCDFAYTRLESDCSIRNNVFASYTESPLTSGAFMRAIVTGNIAFTAGGAVLGDNSVAPIVAGTAASNYPDLATGTTIASVTPAAGQSVRANLFATTQSYGVDGRRKAANDIAGAVAA